MPSRASRLLRSVSKLRSSRMKINNSDGAELSSFEGESVYANSNGLIANLKSSRHSLYCSLIAKRVDEMQTAYEYSIAIDFQRTLLQLHK